MTADRERNHNRSRNRNQVISLFFIRLTEVFMSGVIPSACFSMFILYNPNILIWNIMKLITFAAFVIINHRFLLKYIYGRGNKKEFYILNGAVYLLYCSTSIFVLRYTNAISYSMFFANMRVFELIGLKARQSIYLSNVLIMLNMAAYGWFAYRNTDIKRKRLTAALNTITARDTDGGGSAAPRVTKNGEHIETMPIEKLARLVSAEEEAERQRQEKEMANMPDTMWSDNIVKGRGEAVDFIAPEELDPDMDGYDIDELYNKNAAYSSDALWDDIYKGGKPITEYPDEEEPQLQRPNAAQRFRIELRHHMKSLSKLFAMMHTKIRDNRGEALLDELHEEMYNRRMSDGAEPGADNISSTHE